ncbi:hypothetical protein [Kitasatospora sp. NPDC059571]|uniref:hypothetical protein n=1 Tax=Kitasatospora sp. NPDC059571 TaxID=3346871 RepID=UPI0036754764
MRPPAVSRSAPRTVRRAAAASAATAALLLGVGLPVLSTAGPAWAACGNDPGPALPSEPRHATDPDTAFIEPVATRVAAGGEAVEIGVEEGNLTGAPYQQLAPRFALFASAPAGQPGALANLQPSDVAVEVMWQGQWQRLTLHQSCDPVLVADTSSLAVPLADGHAQRYLFRVSLSAGTPAELRTLDVYAGSTGSDRTAVADLAITRGAGAAVQPTAAALAATAATAPTAPAAAAAPASVQAVGVPDASPAAAGENAPLGPLLAAAAALPLLGGALFAVRRLTRR